MRDGFCVRFSKMTRGLHVLRGLFSISVFGLCQVHELIRCCHWTSAIATGANGTSTTLCFEKAVMAVYTFCITPHSINRACMHVYRCSISIFLVVQKIPLLWLQLKCFNFWSLHNRGYTGAPSVITTLVLPPFVFEEMSEKALHSNKRLRDSGGGFPFLCTLLLPRLYKYICRRSCGFTGLRKNPKT